MKPKKMAKNAAIAIPAITPVFNEDLPPLPLVPPPPLFCPESEGSLPLCELFVVFVEEDELIEQWVSDEPLKVIRVVDCP